jgi:hypothetical protein
VAEPLVVGQAGQREPQCQQHDEHVVDWAEDRDEPRDRVDRGDEVGDGAEEREAADGRELGLAAESPCEARVGGQAARQLDRAIAREGVGR